MDWRRFFEGARAVEGDDIVSCGEIALCVLLKNHALQPAG